MAEIKIPISVDLGNSLQKLKGLSGELGKVEGDVKGINDESKTTAAAISKVGDAGKKISSEGPATFKAQLRAANEELNRTVAQFGATSPAAAAAAKKVAELKDAIGDAKLLTDAFNPDAKFMAFGNALKGVAGAFSAVQGAQALFGSESKAVQETLAKVQGAMALSQGINSILEAKDAFIALGVQLGLVRTAKVANNAADAASATTSAVAALGAEGLALAEGEVAVATEGASVAMGGFKAALIATGIGAAVVAIGLLVANWDKIKESISGVNAVQKALTDTTKDLKEGLKGAYEEVSKVKVAFDLAKKGVISKKEALDVYNNTLGESFGKTNDLLKAEKNLIDKAENYIKLTGLKAQANALFAISAEKSAQTAILQIEREDKRKELAIIGRTYGAKALKEAENKLNKEYDERINKINEESKKIQESAEGLLSQASALAKQSEIKIDPFDVNKSDANAKKIKEKVETVAEIIKKLQNQLDGLQKIELNLGTSTIKEQISAVENTIKNLLTDKELGVKVKQSTIDALVAQLDSLEAKERFINYKAIKIENPVDADLNKKRDDIQSKLDNFKPIELKANYKIEGNYDEALNANLKQTEDFAAGANEILSGAFSDIAVAFGESLGEALTGGNFQDFFKKGLSIIGQAIQDIGKLFIKQAALVQAFNSLVFSNPAAAIGVGIALVAVGAAIKAQATKKLATGGYVSGPGSETSDSIPAMLSDGEFVIKASTVRKYGKTFFERLNQGQVNVSGMIPKFANGGFVRKFAEGGIVFANGSRALVNRTDMGLISDTLNQFNRVIDQFTQKSRALVNRVDDTLGIMEAARGTSRGIVNRALSVPTNETLATPLINEPLGQMVPFIASTEIKGQDLRVVLNRANNRFNNNG